MAVTTTRSSSVAVTPSLAAGAANADMGAPINATDTIPTVRAHPGRHQSLM
ncbi:hypothetical protein GCM10027564_28960 [Luteimonas notoginsengisoli]